ATTTLEKGKCPKHAKRQPRAPVKHGAKGSKTSSHSQVQGHWARLWIVRLKGPSTHRRVNWLFVRLRPKTPSAPPAQTIQEGLVFGIGCTSPKLSEIG
ncbi:MAG: hypothetical protein NZM37_11635, partial [Sandaracinaceae bacterium]|nr:hypothetical protein [Sandaracinaceae bacterium]MDW8247599.1 hypothetical protein [Sandaracinaceae bacterium]